MARLDRRDFIGRAVAPTSGVLASGDTARAQGPPLDGRRFDGAFVQRGKPKGGADVLTFSGGRFRSSACDLHGDGDAPYRAVVVGDAIAFAAQAQSAKQGRMSWRGAVRGDKLDATAMMETSKGKPAIGHWVVAGVVK